MTTQIKNTLVFTNLAPGATILLPHGLFIGTNGILPVTPDIIFIPSPNLNVSADSVNVTLTNSGPTQLSGSILVEYWHTIERDFGNTANEDLPVKPYVVVSAESSGEPPQPPFADTIITIYARTTGSDANGTGTLANPYRTMQRAVRDVPNPIPAAVSFVVDITGIDETLPDNYTLPAWKAPGITDFSGIPGHPSYFLKSPVNILGALQLVTLIPASDAVINFADVTAGDGSGSTPDPITQLRSITLNVARPSWAAGATIAGKFLINADPDGAMGVIDSVDPAGLTISCTGRFAPTFPLRIMEPSAHLHGGGFKYGALNSLNVDCISFLGLKIDSDVGTYGLFADGIGAAMAMLCELTTPSVGSAAYNVVYNNCTRVAYCWVKGSPQFVSNILLAETFMDATDESFQPMFQSPCFPDIISTVFRGCAPVHATAYVPEVGVYRPTAVDRFLLSRCLIADGTGDGVIFNGSVGLFRNTDISGCVGNGISAEEGSGMLKLENCGSSLANLGAVGVRVDDGMMVEVDTNTANTQPVAGRGLRGTGADPDMKVGDLPNRSWGDFEAVTPPSGHPRHNEYNVAAATFALTGVGDTIDADTPVVGTARLTDAAALFTSAMLGRLITIAGGAAGNNGTFLVTRFISATQIAYENAAAVTETVALTWSVNMLVANTAIGTGSRLFQP